LVNPDHLGYKEYLENKDLVVSKDQRVTVASLVFKAFQALLALEERKDPLVKMERMVIREPLDLADPLELMVLLDKWEILDQLDQEDLKEKKGNGVHLVNLDLQDRLDLQENHLVLTWLLYQL
jgi:hypothetical protein